MPVNLRQVTGKHLHRAFMHLPSRLYRNDPLWIPHLKQDLEKVFDPKRNRLFKSGDFARWVLFDDNDKPIGRVAAFFDAKTAGTWSQPTGGIGFFECINDQRAANMLFDACKDWLGKNGMEAMDGPINFGERNMFWGLLAKNFDEPPAYGMNHNPPYYVQLFENYGFQIFYEQWMYHRAMYEAEPVVFEKSERLLAQHPKARVTSARKMTIEEMAGAFEEVFNAAWGNHEGVGRVTFERAYKVIRSIRQVMDPDIILYAWDGDRPIGFYLNLPELNQIFRYVPKGNLNWLGKLIFLWHKWRHTPDRMYGVIFGVVPEYQGKGVESLMVRYASEHVLPLSRYKDTILAWVGDFNVKMIRVCENLGAKVFRVYHTYRYLFDRTKPFERHRVIT